MKYLYINRTVSSITPDDVKSALPKHLDWVKTEKSKGTLFQAGKWGDAGGAGIIEAESLESATDCLKSDPFVIKRLVEYEIHPYFID